MYNKMYRILYTLYIVHIAQNSLSLNNLCVYNGDLFTLIHIENVHKLGYSQTYSHYSHFSGVKCVWNLCVKCT